MTSVALAQHGATVTLNLAVAAAVGASASMLWLADGTSPWAARAHRRLRPFALASLVVGLAAYVCVFWLEAASMAEVPVWRAGAAMMSMASQTHFGMAFCAGLLALAIALAALASSQFRNGAMISLVATAAYFYTRSMVSHAADNGDISLPVGADWLHLVTISLWVGEVIVAGLVTMTVPVVDSADRKALGAYASQLSSSATAALAAIVLSGSYAAWRNLGALENLTGSAYGMALLLKLSAVLTAALLGGANRFLVMPGLLAAVRGDSPITHRFAAILKVEALVLVGVLILAAVLSSTAPPTAG